ncbi:MAG: mevalonate kinase, partial [Bdellovibrionota bacterium]
QEMKESVELARRALGNAKGEESLSHLAQALDIARDCFQQWGLCGDELNKHMDILSEEGSLSVKPTGSGGGGYVLSLWSQPPPASLSSTLLPL